MPIFDPALTNDPNDEINLSTFTDGELADFNAWFRNQYQLFSNDDLALIKSKRQLMLGDLNTAFASYRARANQIFEEMTTFIRSKFQDKGLSIKNADVSVIWRRIPAYEIKENPVTINKDTFGPLNQSMLLSRVVGLMNGDTASKTTFTTALVTKLDHQQLVDLLYKTLQVQTGKGLKETEGFLLPLTKRLLLEKNTNPRLITNRIGNALDNINNKDWLMEAMGLKTYWENSNKTKSAMLEQVCSRLAQKDGQGRPTADAEIMFSTLLKPLHTDIQTSFDSNPPIPPTIVSTLRADYIRLAIANVLIFGLMDFRDGATEGVVSFLLSSARPSEVAKAISTTVMTNLKNGTQAQVDALTRPILAAAYGNTAVTNGKKLFDAQFDTIISGKSSDDTYKKQMSAIDAVVNNRIQDTEQKQRIEASKKVLESQKWGAAISAGLLGGNPFGVDTSINARANLVQGALSNIKVAFPVNKDDPPVLQVWKGFGNGFLDATVGEMVAKPVSGMVGSLANTLNKEGSGALNDLFSWVTTGDISNPNSKILTGILGGDIMGGLKELGALAFPWLVPGGDSITMPQLSIPANLSNLFGLDQGVIKQHTGVSHTGPKQVFIDDTWLNADKLKPGALGKPTIRLVSNAGGIEFNLLPATKTNLQASPGGDGQDMPFGAQGIAYYHTQNLASIDIPGSSPVFQSLGISQEIIEFCGALTSYGNRVPGKDFKHGLFPFGMETDSDGKPLSDLKVADLQQDERTFMHAFGAMEKAEGALMGIVRAGLECVFSITYEYIRSGTKSLSYDVIPIKVQRLQSRKDKVYYKITMVRVSWGQADAAIANAENVTSIAEAAASLVKAREIAAAKTDPAPQPDTGGDKGKTGNEQKPEVNAAAAPGSTLLTPTTSGITTTQAVQGAFVTALVTGYSYVLTGLSEWAYTRMAKRTITDMLRSAYAMRQSPSRSGGIGQINEFTPGAQPGVAMGRAPGGITAPTMHGSNPNVGPLPVNPEVAKRLSALVPTNGPTSISGSVSSQPGPLAGLGRAGSNGVTGGISGVGSTTTATAAAEGTSTAASGTGLRTGAAAGRAGTTVTAEVLERGSIAKPTRATGLVRMTASRAAVATRGGVAAAEVGLGATRGMALARSATGLILRTSAGVNGLIADLLIRFNQAAGLTGNGMEQI